MNFEGYKLEIEKSSRKEVCEKALEKAKAVQPALNAMVTFVDYDDSYLEEADKDSYLYGLPIVLKDNVNTKGIRTTASSRILDNYIPVYDAHVWAKLKKAGAILIGKASLSSRSYTRTSLGSLSPQFAGRPCSKIIYSSFFPVVFGHYTTKNAIMQD